MSKGLYRIALILGGMLLGTQALAWTQGGTGGDVDLGGTIDPTGPVNPWEVKMGTGFNDLNIVLSPGHTQASILLQKDYPVLGIRTRTGDGTFPGTEAGGIAPQITYSGLVAKDAFSRGWLPLELNVTSKAGDRQLGVLKLRLLAGAEISYRGTSTDSGQRFSVFATQAGDAFYGGIARNTSEAILSPARVIGARFAEYINNYNTQGVLYILGKSNRTDFKNSALTYSAFYGAGLVSGDEMIMQLNAPFQPDTVNNWKAQLTVTIKYI